MQFKKRFLLNIFITAAFFSGCSSFWEPVNQKEKEFLEEIEKSSEDYADQLQSLSTTYLKNPEVKEVRLTGRATRYLKRLIKVLTANNELLFKRPEKQVGEFHIIHSKLPFVFSLPGYKFFISDGLILDYLKNESLLQAVLTKEAIKSDQLIYPRKKIIPIGYITTPEIISLTRLRNKTKQVLNTWTFVAMKRASWDPFAILNWIQTQNKNILDFSFQIENRRSIAREEAAFRSFVASKEVKISEEILENSSEDFYHLIRVLKRSNVKKRY